MKSNKSSGGGKLSYSTDGGSNYTYIVGSSSSGSSFNTSNWYGSWSTSYVNVTKSVDITATTSDLIIKIEATANSIFCQSYTITYEAVSSTYSVTYDGNGSTSGSVPTDATKYDKDATVTVLGNTGSLAKAGYTFGGWNTKADGSGTTYDADDTFSITANTTLYAKWNAKTAAGLAYATSSYTVLPGASFDTPTLSNDNDLTVSYLSNNTSVASVNSSTGAVTIGTTEGTATITASSEEDETYAAGSASYTITVAKGTTTVTLNNDELSFNIIDGTTQTLTGTPKYNSAAIDGAAVTWSVVSGSDYASVSDAGVVTALAPGSATIRASYAGTTVYASSYAECAVTVNKANTTLNLDEDEVEQDLKDGRTITLTPTVKAAKSDASEMTLASPTVTWESSDETVATVSGGVVTGLKAGEVTITASYAGAANYKAADDATCSITFSDTRTAVSISTFTATKTTLVIGDEQATTVTNDQTGWTPTYTYSSSNTSVATVDEDGVITAVAKGTATITATINISLSETGYKAGATASKTLSITVTKPFHTVTFSVNGNTDRTASVEEDQAITFPTAVETTPGDGEFPKVINGKTFVGWYGSTYENASTAPTYVTSPTMSTSDVTYYAVFADVTETESDDVANAKLAQTLEYDTWTKGGTSSDQSTYRLFGNTGYVESSSFDLSKLIKVIVYGGTYGGDSYNTLTIGDGTNTWKDVTVTGKSATGENTYTGGTALSGTKALRVTSTCGNGSSNGVRISKVKIFVKGTVVTKKNFNTTVSLLPIPVITVSDVEMTWGDTDKSIAASATIDEEDYDGSFTYECEDDDLTIESDGSLSCDEPGEYEVTVSIAATAEHQAASKTITVTVNKKDITLSFDNDAIIKMTTDETKTFTETATADPDAYSGTISYAISGSGSATINTSTGAVTYTTTAGVNIITATAPATSYYNGNTATYTLYVKTTPTITVSNQTLAYGATYTPTITGGTASISTVPANMATIEDGVITATAVGTATVTVSTEATDTYVAGEESFTLTVTAPTALSTIPDPAPVSVFYESFDTNNGTGANDDTWNGSIAGGTFASDNDGWTVSSAKGAYRCAKFGTTSAGGSATTPDLKLKEDVIYTLTFKAAAWDATGEGTSLSISGTNATIRNEANTDDVSSVTTSKGKWTSYTLKVIVTDDSKTANITFSTSGGNKRFFLDEVRLTRPGDPIESVAITIPSSGLGTYCSQYPLDFSDTENNDDNFKAYVVTGIEDNNITLQKLTTEVKGGVPFIIKGEGGDVVNVPTAASSSNVPSNVLVGTLAPTYVTGTTTGYTNYGMSGGVFKKINTGIVPANRAYLPIPDAEGAREFNMIFLDDEVTGIETIRQFDNVRFDNAVYDMQGRRVSSSATRNSNLPKGLYIVNGRKVVIK